MRWFSKTRKNGAPLYQDRLQRWSCFYPDANKKTHFYESKVNYLFVTKYYHKKSMDPNSFMYHLTYKGNIVGNEKCSKFRCVLYEYKFETTRHHKHDDPTQLDWLFPKYYSKTFRLSVKGFVFAFPSLSGSLKTFLSHHKI